MSEQLTLDVDVQPGRICPGCGASYGPHAQWTQDVSRRYCYTAACTTRENAR